MILTLANKLVRLRILLYFTTYTFTQKPRRGLIFAVTVVAKIYEILRSHNVSFQSHTVLARGLN